MDQVLKHYATSTALTAPDGPLHVGWWDAPHEDLARAERDYEDRLLAPLDLSAGDRVLDLGCGFGALARRLARDRGCTVTGVDLVPHHIAGGQAGLAADGVTGVTLQVADARALPFPDASFDAAVALEVLLHLSDPTPAARELARVVRPGGRVAVSDYLLHPDGRRGHHALARALLDTSHLSRADHTHAAFRAVGFDVLADQDVTDQTVVAFYDWSRREGHATLRDMVSRTLGRALAPLTPATVALGRWSARSGAWGLHFLHLRRR